LALLAKKSRSSRTWLWLSLLLAPKLTWLQAG
jgi:hypothetical protein